MVETPEVVPGVPVAEPAPGAEGEKPADSAAPAETAPLETLVTSLAMGLPFEPLEKQALLEAPTLVERVDALTTLLEIDALEDGDDAGHSMQ